MKTKKTTPLTLTIDRLKTLQPAQTHGVEGGMQLVTTIIQNF